MVLYSIVMCCQASEEGEDGVMKVHQLREELTHLRDVNRTLYSLLTEKTSSFNPLNTD